ncbi:MAG: alpha-L-fucosidase [Candidatus Acidiferrum sp.]
MSMTRRTAIGVLAGAVPALRAAGKFSDDASAPEIAPGPFKGTRESLASWEVPAWFRDAKFGLWAHWGPQSAAEAGDWYARNMYMQDSEQYKYHVAHYGHPSKFGFKDVVQTWKGEKFDAEYLIGLYKKAGAKYFVSMGVHHDNFDMWNSKHTRWNAANMGPKKDIVGLFKNAARKQGLRFGVSDHLWISYKWFSVSHGSDKTGPLAGVPYDGVDPQNADLYHRYPEGDEVPYKLEWNENHIPEEWKQQWFRRIKDLVDQHQPDLLYSDGGIQFEQYGLGMVAHAYNVSAKLHGGRTEAVFASKHDSDCEVGTCVLDRERAVVDAIWPRPWQTDTCVGTWHYKRGVQYKTPKRVIDMLVDIVSRNGNLLLNFPLPSSGMLDAEELNILDNITKWISVNGEGIYATRPWKIFGDGPNTPAPADKTVRFNESKRKDLTADDVRYTTKGKTLYAFVMGWPEKEAVIKTMALGGAQQVPKIQQVELLGFPGKVVWTQDEVALKVQLPKDKPSEHAFALKIAGVV